MTCFRVLFVCIGNVCRSPLGERLLATRLPGEEFEIASAGVAALAGSPMVPEAAVQLESYGGSGEGFVARSLTPAMVERSDLVLTATKAIRSRVLEDCPGALRRTFTVREFAALLDLVPLTGGVSDPAALVAAAAAQRSRGVGEYDIPDPYGRGDEAHVVAGRLMADAVERIGKRLRPED